MATIYEVAARAGVSPATVSRVLNGARVAEDLASKVREAAAELDFTPSRTARSLRRRHSDLIALLIPDIENPFFTAVARGVEDRTRAAGYSLVLCNTDEDPDREREYLRVAAGEQMAGVILAPTGDRTDLSALASRPVVAVDRAPHGVMVDTVTIDNRRAGWDATRLLQGRGCRRIACITGPAGVDTADERAEGWRDAVREATGAAPDPGLLRHGDFRYESGGAELTALLAGDSRPDGVVVANNLMGAGALRALGASGAERGAVQLAVIGDLPFTSLEPAGVAVVHLPARELGDRAAALLLERIGGDDSPARRVLLPAESPATRN
ncbi:LacI family DNA-binding transcriptional regulator [Naasia sp. SYSU D00057]|uniref:LacI family DNA-binding transcriptional regulator n=1 Tax=Naasia sp. SYSU D00057 TaxID=2817380 RepID=UPI001B313365|nr:LacI family DNA-binding transcriptional regulator [Naasia sp. SYSU D00057]